MRKIKSQGYLYRMQKRQHFAEIWNTEIVELASFPDELKLADITPVFKKRDATIAKNYRPIRVLPSPSKLFERMLSKQLTEFIDSSLSPFLCGYRKGYSPQRALIQLIEKWKKNTR